MTYQCKLTQSITQQNDTRVTSQARLPLSSSCGRGQYKPVGWPGIGLHMHALAATCRALASLKTALEKSNACTTGKRHTCDTSPNPAKQVQQQQGGIDHNLVCQNTAVKCVTRVTRAYINLLQGDHQHCNFTPEHQPLTNPLSAKHQVTRRVRRTRSHPTSNMP